MRAYRVIYRDQIIKQGESNFYEDCREIVPKGFYFMWAFNSPELLTINVESDVEPIEDYRMVV